jgi:hypothetical protein
MWRFQNIWIRIRIQDKYGYKFFLEMLDQDLFIIYNECPVQIPNPAPNTLFLFTVSGSKSSAVIEGEAELMKARP